MQNSEVLAGNFLILLIITKGYPMPTGFEKSSTSHNRVNEMPQESTYSNQQYIPAQPYQQPSQMQPHQHLLPVKSNQQQLPAYTQQLPAYTQHSPLTSHAQQPVISYQNSMLPQGQQPIITSQTYQHPVSSQAYQPQIPSRSQQSAFSTQPRLSKIPSFSTQVQNTSQPYSAKTNSESHHSDQYHQEQQHNDQKSASQHPENSNSQYQKTEPQQQQIHVPLPPPVPHPNSQIAHPKPKTDYGYSSQFKHASETIDSVPIPYMKYDQDETPVLHYGHDDLDEEYGDRRVREGEFPYFVQLRSNGKLFCGAALIRSPVTGRQVVITALHCLVEPGTSKLYSPEILTLRMGVIGVDDVGQERKARAILAHSGYVLFGPSKRPIFDDIGLVIPDTEFNLNKHVQTVDLPGQNLPTKWNDVIIKGFGKGREAGHMDITKYMRTISVPVWDNAACNKAYYEESGANLITDGHFCAGSRTGGLDSCQGDSGGPATTMEKGKMYLVGVVSWGKGCGKKSYPGVYARVWSYTNWIKMTLFDYEINGVLPPPPKYPQ